MVWKRVINADAGTADKFGGNDLDKIADAFNGVDVSDPINYNVDINALKANTNTLGDILKSNGTKYVRLPKGTANQVLAVNAGATDIAWTTLAAGTGDITAGANVGTGAGLVFKDKTGSTLNFKRLAAGTNVTVTNGTDDVTIASTGGGGGGDVTGAANVGTGEGSVFRDETTGVLNLKTLKQGTNITLTNNANDVTIASAAGTGEANTGANVGSGTGTIFRDKTGVTLNLKTILGGSNITVTNNANDITLASTGGGATTLDGLTDVAVTSAARGDIIVRDATQFVNRAKGIANQVLAMDGAGTDPVWTTPSAALNPEFTYLIYKEGANYKQLNGATGAIITSSDFSDLVNDIITAISPAGTPTVIEIGPGDFLISSATAPITINSTRVGNITIRGQGQGITNLIVDDAITTQGGMIITGDVAAGSADLPLTANALKGSTTITMSTANGNTLVAGDYILLRSTKNWSAHVNANGKQGEIHRVLSVASGVVTVDKPIHDTYNTADVSNARELAFLNNITIQNLTIKGEVLALPGTGPFMKCMFIDNLLLDNIESRDNGQPFGTGVNLWSVINSKVSSCTFTQSITNTYNDQYGIQCVAACENVVIESCAVRGRFRHAIMPANGAGSTNTEGACRNVIVVNCVVEIGAIGPYDTHIEGEGIIFSNCTAIGGRPVGTANTNAFSIRSKKTKIIGCIVQNTIGRAISLFDDANECSVIGTTVSKVKRNGASTDGYGISMSSGITDTEIRGCDIESCGTDGIWFEGGNARTKILDCTIKNNAVEATGYGINCASATACIDCDIKANTISGNTAAINVADTSHTGWDIQDNNCRANTNISIIRGSSHRTYNNLGLTGFDGLVSLNKDKTTGKYGAHTLTTATGGDGVFNGLLTALGTGVYSITLSDTEGTIANFTTGTTINDVAGFRLSTSIARRNRLGSLYFTFSIDVTTTVRIFIGVHSSAATTMSGADPLNALHGCGLAISAGKFMIAHNDGTGATVFDDFTSARTVDTGLHNVKIIGTATGYYIEWDDGVTSKTITTDIPSGSQSMGVQAMIEATAATATRKLQLTRFEGFF